MYRRTDRSPASDVVPFSDPEQSPVEPGLRRVFIAVAPTAFANLSTNRVAHLDSSVKLASSAIGQRIYGSELKKEQDIVESMPVPEAFI
jgi:hypothetical protein